MLHLGRKNHFIDVVVGSVALFTLVKSVMLYRVETAIHFFVAKEA